MVEKTGFYLEYLPIKFLMIAKEAAILPEYLGSTLRGAVGQLLRKDPEACHFLYDNRRLDQRPKEVLNPYIIIPPVVGKTSFDTNDVLEFDILFLGDGAKYAQNVIDALGTKGTVCLGASRKLFLFDKAVHKTDQRTIWKEGDFYPVAMRSVPLLYKTLDKVQRVTIQFQTPLRMRRNNELLQRVDFPSLIRNITNRVKSLTGRYGGWVDEQEIGRIQQLSLEVSIIEQKTKLVDMERYSNRTNEKMYFGGLMGTMVFEGELSSFVPWLYAAQVLHIGGNTTFGMGRIEVEFI